MNFEQAMAQVEQGESAWRDGWIKEDDFWIGEHLGKIYRFVESTCLNVYSPTDEDRAATDWDTTR